MQNLRRIAAKVASFLFFAFVFITFFNGYADRGPSRKKFKRLGESSEQIDLTIEDTTPDVNLLKPLMKDKRLNEWVNWWQKYAPGFSLESMDDTGLGPMYDEDIKALTKDEIGEGPEKMFYRKSPDGKRYLNPFFRRMHIKKEGDAWQPYIEIPCGVAIYTPGERLAKNVYDCSALEGIEDGFWVDKDRFVLMGYTSITRHMNVECETVESCVAPTVWIFDLKSKLINEQNGPLIKRNKCELGGYLKISLPDFFEAEKKP